MDFLRQFFLVYIHYCHEIWLILIVGFFLSGIFYQFVPTQIVERHLGQKGIKPIFIASLVGMILPVCCLGSLPIALTLRRKGARLGAVFAFLVATPATSISAVFVCWRLLGFTFTLYIVCSVIVMGLLTGYIFDHMNFPARQNAQNGDACCDDHRSQDGQPNISIRFKFRKALKYAFVTLPKEIGLEILIGIAIASFISIFIPIQHFIQQYLTGFVGYLVILIVGLLTYVCSTASVPLADALLQSGMSKGQALCYLLVGPITSYGTMLVIRKDFGLKALIVYLSIICILSLTFALALDILNYRTIWFQ